MSARDDCVRNSPSDEDFWLLNQNWKTFPSIMFIDGRGPAILICKEHEHGSNVFVIYLCRRKNSLLSKNLDQLCQAVIKLRVIRPIKTSK